MWGMHTRVKTVKVFPRRKMKVCLCLLDLMPIQDAGHLSYACPKNILGDRDPPKKKEKKKKKKGQQPDRVYVLSSLSTKRAYYLSEL